MSPPKDKQQKKGRPATVVYQRMTPELMLAYRIFSPGLGDQEGLDNLNHQMHRITEDVYVEEEVSVENGKEVRRGVGLLEDLQRKLNVTKAQISQAYDAYKAEIERMMDEDKAHLERQASDEASDATMGKRGTKRKSSSHSPISERGTKRKASSSPAQATGAQRKSPSSSIEASSALGRLSSSPIDLTAAERETSPGEMGGDDGPAADNSDNKDNNDHEKDQEQEEDQEDGGNESLDENERYTIPTDEWQTKSQALAKLSDAQRRVDAMRSRLDDIHHFYTTQMLPRHEITETFQSAFSYMTRVRNYVQEIYEIVEEHNGEVRRRGEVNIWEDDRTDVTRLVVQLIPMVDEIPLRVVAMEAILAEVEWLKERLAKAEAKAAVESTRKKFRAKLAEFVKQAHTPVPPPYCEGGK